MADTLAPRDLTNIVGGFTPQTVSLLAAVSAADQSETSLAKFALAALSHTSLLSDLATDNSPAGKMCKQFLPIARREALAAHDHWRFASRLQYYYGELVVNPDRGIFTNPLGEYAPTERYRVPINPMPLRLVAVYPYCRTSPDRADRTRPLRWDNQSLSTILVKEQRVVVDWVYDEPNPAQWSASFFSAVGYRLAFHIALPLTRSVRAKNSMLDAYGQMLNEAIRLELQSMPPQTVDRFRDEPTFMAARDGHF